MLRPEVALGRKSRRQMSYPEVLLWQRLRGQATGFKFRKQHPLGPSAADFRCLSARLVVEVDGAVHDGAGPQKADAARTAFMEENGYRVFRVAAADVERDMAAMIAGIVALAAAPLHRPADGPPPRSGEDM